MTHKKLIVLVLAMWAGCTSLSTPAGQNGTDTRKGLDIPAVDLSTGDKTGPSVDTGSDAGTEIMDSTDATDVPGRDLARDATCPGNPGCACKDNTDCYSGFCVEGPNGSVCASLCDSDAACGRGYKCSSVQNTSGDTVFICIYKFPNLCRPCMKDEDCANPVLDMKNRCVDFGADGKFCGVQCSTNTDCPVGYECRDVPQGNGTVKQCTPEKWQCPCTDKFKNNAYTTTCYKENPFGRCYGHRTCDQPCDAREPAPEKCNNVDDDCNGQTDDNVPSHECEITNQYGTCKGKTLCIAGKELCQGRQPAREACNGMDDDCNGQTDEGFPDTDGDGVANCVDNCPDVANPDQKDTNHDGVGDACSTTNKDSDGDGDPDSTDCAPNDPTISHKAQEKCDGKDDNCNGTVDDENAKGCTVYYMDSDGDGYGVTSASATSRCLCSPQGDWRATSSDDCNDNDKAIHPGAAEVCDGKDNNCDGSVDDGANICPNGSVCKDGQCVQGCTPVNGGWTDWNCPECSACATSVTCTRTCTNPAPSCGGQNCTGPSTKAKSCDESGTLVFAGRKKVFDKCGDNFIGTVPSGIRTIHVKMWGGGGGGGAPGSGGGGAFVKADLSVSSGDKIEVRVGCGGPKKAGGAGASYVFLNSRVVLVAAGGGGGGVDGCSGCSKDNDIEAGAGGAGGPVGGKGQDGRVNNDGNTGSEGGKGGTQTAGGAGGISNDHSSYDECHSNGFPGAANQGGYNHAHCKRGYAAKYQKPSCLGIGDGAGGGGGSGWYGGGSGAAKWTYSGGGGGGGSSYASPDVARDVYSEGGNWAVPGGTSDPDYNGHAGRGGQGTTDSFDNSRQAQPGQDGLIVLTW